MESTILHTFMQQLSGDVILPESPEYATLSNVANQAGSPALIARVRNHADIALSVRFAREQQLTLSVRSGGHGFTGLGTNQGGLIIDLNHLNSIEVLDETQRLVRIGAGARWGEVAQALAPYGLALTSGDTNQVGVAGLTLGGGIGWMVRNHGLTIDSLVAVELVTANGELVRASENEHPDLFWAVRGGGGNFGVATAFEFKAVSKSMITGGLAIYEATDAASVLAGWTRAMREAPEELNSTIVLFPGFGPQGIPQVNVLLAYSGDEALADEVIRPFLQLGTLKSQNIERKAYHAMLENAFAAPGMKVMSQTGFVPELTPDVQAAMVENYGTQGKPILQIRALGGAVDRVSPEATAFPHRGYEALAIMAIIHPAALPAEQVNGMRLGAWAPLAAHTSGAYSNFQSDASPASISAIYPESTYARLAAVKATYDPENIFKQNHNVQPAK